MKSATTHSLLTVLVLVATAAIGRAATQIQESDAYFPLMAAPEQHKTVFENEFVLVLDVSIPAGVTVPAHLHPWPAVFITLEPAHLVFRSLAGEIVREVRRPAEVVATPRVEWRTPDREPASVANVGSNAMRALRVELKFLAP